MITLRAAMRRRDVWKFPTLTTFSFPAPVTNTAATLLPFAFWLQIRLSEFQAKHDGKRDVWFSTLAIPIVDPKLPFGAIHEYISASGLGLVALMSIALLILCWTPPRDMSARIAVALSGCALAILAITAPVLTSSDAYFYLFVGDVGASAYAPTPQLFTGSYATMQYYVPLHGLIYGPLWVAVNSYTQALGHTITQKIMALRVFNAAIVLVSALLFRRFGASPRAQLAFVLNPMIWFYIVLNVHNDLMAIAPCIAAILVARRSACAAVALVVVAACIKLPCLIAGLPAFACLGSFRKALIASACAGALSIAASLEFAGVAYFKNLLGYSDFRSGQFDVALKVFTISAALTSSAFLMLAVFRNRFFPRSAFLIAYLSPLASPWYLVWGLPYAVVARSQLALTLFLLPISATLLDNIYNSLGVSQMLFTITGTACLLDTVHARLSAYRTRP